MLKRAVILHGTDANPANNWFPWLTAYLEEKGYGVWVPLLPNNHTPSRLDYNDLLFNAGWDFTDNLVIGHSSGAVSVLNLLQDARCPRIDTGVLVGAWSQLDGTDLDREQFANLFPETGFDFDEISKKASHLVYFHGSDDPFCPLSQAKWLAAQTSSDIVVIPNGHHLGDVRTELPELTTYLKTHELL